MSRTDDVVDGVKRMILNGDLNPGDRLPVEKDLASRTPPSTTTGCQETAFTPLPGAT